MRGKRKGEEWRGEERNRKGEKGRETRREGERVK